MFSIDNFASAHAAKPKLVERLQRAAETFATAKEQGFITKREYDAAKYDLATVWGAVYHDISLELFTIFELNRHSQGHADLTQPQKDIFEAFSEAIGFEFGHFATYLRRFKAMKIADPKADAHRQRTLLWLEELLPLHTAMKDLKGTIKTVKQEREAKAAEEARRKKILLSKNEVQAAVAAIEEFTTKISQELVDAFTKYFTSSAERIGKAIDDAKEAGLTYGDFRKQLEKGRDEGLVHIANRLVNVTDTDAAGRYRDRNKNTEFGLVSKSEIDAFIEKEVKYQKDLVVESYKAKLVDKTGQILGNKQGLKTVKVRDDYRIRTGTIESDIDYTFEDGSKFSVNLQVVWVTNQQNTTFFRTPLRFYNVEYTDNTGKLVKMPAPTEEKMYELFVDAA
jgi:hypothetical protein